MYVHKIHYQLFHDCSVNNRFPEIYHGVENDGRLIKSYLTLEHNTIWQHPPAPPSTFLMLMLVTINISGLFTRRRQAVYHSSKRTQISHGDDNTLSDNG